MPDIGMRGRRSASPGRRAMTFSIVGIDNGSRTCGSAVASFSMAVGGTVSYSRIGVGVINTQHHAHLALGNHVLDEMEDGKAPHEALADVLSSDAEAESRQLIAIDMTGRRGGWTGRSCAPVRRHIFGNGCIAAGNFLVSDEVVGRMVEAFESAAGDALGARLLSALIAGERAGGDRRGRKSAAVSVTPGRDAAPAINLDLRVDLHDEPIRELERMKQSFESEFG